MMNIFNMTEIIAKQSQLTKEWISFTIFIIIPFATILISAIARIFCKKTLIVTGTVLSIALLIDLLFFRDIVITLMAILYYFMSFIGCFVTLVCEGILHMINTSRCKTDIDSYGKSKKYFSGALQGKKRKRG